MSQKKTVVPGMDNSDASFGDSRSATGNFYSRDNNARSARHGTVIPGMENTQPRDTKGDNPNTGRNQNDGKPIIGFLYSVSRMESGEYWPLHIGQNTIGNSSECDICLPEATISNEHAILVIRKMKKPEKVIASISDTRSTNGTMLNGESLGFAAVDCKNGDILTFGECYELYLVLIDVAELGLKKSESFISTNDDGLDIQEENIPHSIRDTVPPRFVSPEAPRSSNGTVGLNGGGGASFGKGGTQGM